MASRMPSARARRVFVDSSAYLALLDDDDQHHEEATTILRALAKQWYRQFTTNVLVIEAHALILSTLGIADGQAYLRSMEAGSTVVIRARASDEERARRIVYRYADKDFSLADAISFAVMERLRITQAFTFDRHFAQYGLSVLTAEWPIGDS
jgi:predicted nucleic acid-binding protein